MQRVTLPHRDDTDTRKTPKCAVWPNFNPRPCLIASSQETHGSLMRLAWDFRENRTDETSERVVHMKLSWETDGTPMRVSWDSHETSMRVLPYETHRDSYDNIILLIVSCESRVTIMILSCESPWDLACQSRRSIILVSWQSGKNFKRASRQFNKRQIKILCGSRESIMRASRESHASLMEVSLEPHGGLWKSQKSLVLL